MAKKRKKPSHLFFLGMVIYALVFMVFLAIGLRVFWDYINDYEKSQPQHAIDDYIASFDSEHIRAISSDFVATLDHGLQSEEDSYAVIEDLFKGRLLYSCVESGETRMVYDIVSDGKKLGTMTLVGREIEKPGAPWTVSEWTVSDESFDFSWLLSSKEITVPSDWTVSCGGKVLGDEYITERNIKYASLEEAYEYGINLPYLVKYEIDDYIGDIPFTVVDWSGNETVMEGGVAEAALSDRCTSEERERMEDFARRFLPLYIAFMSNSNHNAYDNYARVKPYLLPGSDLDNRFLNAIAGQVYSHSYGDVLHDVVCNGVVDLGGGTFLIDLDYQVDTTGQAGTVTSSAGVYIVAEDHGGDGIFATSLFVK